MATCYRHPSQETAVSCSSCGRPICPDCMTTTSVGMRCPECSRERTKVRTTRTLQAQPAVTYALIALNVLAFVGSAAASGGLSALSGGGGRVLSAGSLYAPAIADRHEYWRLLTSGFLHFGLFHIALNMYFLYILGTMLEPAYGRARFAALYFTSLLAGSLGALLLQPDAHTAGASGALYGLLGAAIVAARVRGISLWSSGLGLTLVLNLAFTVSFSGRVSIGGHLGGLVGGLLVGALLESRRRERSLALALAGCAGLAAVAVAGAIAVSGSSTAG